MTGFGEQHKSIKQRHKKKKSFKEQIINQAINFHLQGNISEAEKYYQYCINQDFNDNRVFCNYGVILQGIGKLQEAELSTRRAIELKPNCEQSHFNLGNILKDLGKLQEAELSFRKAIKINPDFAMAHSNLGNICKDLGKLQEAELSFRKAIKINPDFAMAHYSLSLLKYSDENNILQNKILSKINLNKQSKKDQIYIYFAQANILHNKKKYKESSKFLKLANQLKLSIYPSTADNLINQSKVLLLESDKKEIQQQENIDSPQSIFIVGMPRSGSTLVESILSRRNDVFDLGEINILEEAFIESKHSKQDIYLSEIYKKKVSNITKLNISTNKWLYNYQYVGIIAKQIPNAKIIHCFRNPLDNILSIYRTHFSAGNQYSCSLVDCAKVYLDQDEIMTKYKNRFRSKIYDLNYEKLVVNPKPEIKSLISWLGWDWDDQYLSPHLNPRSVSTASNIQVRSPINSKSIGGWKHYKEMLKPTITILSQNHKYQDINS